ncbi:hypothetical protein EVB81_124 [Rhizobium phage RHph_I46]|uniref:Uncharacterized protein n=1 Tax=Rhizobium phage RHph_I1_9 TaxID=2509729 RepID=A0A7S5UWQ9_9CAUD|nr:hypothetical protein PP936_gp123 [Rhizobium phage RHph_I1_9]QIG69693.1 hypothetical protein EVB81_124 [Rhizobium phage RHph_I46]QIG70974.1 hypothetical protein EVB92_124 [Rhizobium phage RHph_I9]QIG73560.1 hypothetical protein EVC04_123 [Rhizobium phage RHph_I1_9]QIG76313.1 hypothetical protein EVC25_124 [Rhizobium phage RHph_I34]
MGDELESSTSFEDFFDFRDGKISVKEGSDTSFAVKLLVDKANETARNQTAEAVKDTILKATVATLSNIQSILNNYTTLIEEIKSTVVDSVSHNG